MSYAQQYLRAASNRVVVTVSPQSCQPFNDTTTLNNMKLVHWPLMGGLLHLLQRGRRGGDWYGHLLLSLLPTEGRRLSRPSWLVTYRDGLPVHRRSPILVLTGSDVAQLR